VARHRLRRQGVEDRLNPPGPPPAEPVDAARAAAARARLVHALRPRFSRRQLVTALLCAVLGFGAVMQVRHTAQADFSALSEDELVQMLDELTRRSDELEARNAQLESQRNQLEQGQSQAEAAATSARERARTQGILAGTLPARGPGIVLTIYDPRGKLVAADLYHVIEDLRNAGAEAISVGEQRVSASTWVADGPGGLEVDSAALSAPYVWRAIGDPATLDVAMQIPGGVGASVRAKGGTFTIERQLEVVIDATRELADFRHASPVPEP
jgi:uncharacterized protein YlxW (UPF0749 family)